MCLSIPAQILSIQGLSAKASVGGTVVNIAIDLLEDIVVGDFVLVHTGIALQKIGKEEAEETLRLLKEMISLDDDSN
jgi:hydrogenase expression/formation protein HypC